MSTRARMLGMLSALVVGTSALAASAAPRAEASFAPIQPQCSVSIGAGMVTVGASGPASGTVEPTLTLPVNAPALLLADASTNGGTPTVAGELLTGDARAPLGAPTKDAHGLMAMTLPSATVGEHTLRLTMSCSQRRDTIAWTTAVTFTPAVTLPTSVGTLTVVPADVPTGTDTVRLQPSAELRAFLPVAELRAKTNGVAHEGRLGARITSELEFSMHTGSVCIENGALVREKRIAKVEIEAAIAGASETPAPALLEVPVDCGAIQWTSGKAAPGEGAPQPGASDGEASDGSCAVVMPGRDGSRGISLATAITVSLGVLLRRRKRAAI